MYNRDMENPHSQKVFEEKVMKELHEFAATVNKEKYEQIKRQLESLDRCIEYQREQQHNL